MDLPNADWSVTEGDPENPVPPKPRGLDLNLFFNLEAPRPDEFYGQRAMRWTQAARDQQVYRDAMQDVKSEAAAYQMLATTPAARVD